MPQLQRTLTPADYERAAAALGCEVAAIRAVAAMESSGDGFLPDGRPTILFDAHVFNRLTAGRFAFARDRKGVQISVLK